MFLRILWIEHKKVSPNVKIREVAVPPYCKFYRAIMRTNVTNYHWLSISDKLIWNYITNDSLCNGDYYKRIMLNVFPVYCIVSKSWRMFPKMSPAEGLGHDD